MSYSNGTTLNPSLGTNYILQQTCQNYGVPPFVLSDGSDGNPTNFYCGRYDIPSLIQAIPGLKINFPCAVISVAMDDAMGTQAMRITPSVFSGPVIISLEVYPVYQGSDLPADGQAYFHAIEEAVMGTFNTQESYSMMPSGITYNNEIRVEQGPMIYERNRWIQKIAFTLKFYAIRGEF